MQAEKGLRLDRKVVFCENPPYPNNMMVALSNFCNHQCVFCAYHKSRAHVVGAKARVSIDKDFLWDVMRQAHELGTREIGLYTTTEPFTSAMLEEAVARAKEIGFDYIYLTTNGSLATPQRIRTVFENGLNSIKYSINAADRESYKRLHGKDDWGKVIENLKAADAIRKEVNPDIGIFVSFIECCYTQGHGERLKEQIAQWVDKVYVLQGTNQGGSMYDELQSGIVQRNTTKACAMIFNRFHVTPEGFLTACCVDFDNDLVVADLRTMSLKDAWNCEAFVALRRQHLRRDLGSHTMCYNCIHNADHHVLPWLPQQSRTPIEPEHLP